MQIKSLVVGPFEVNCFIVSNEPGRAVVIDPGADAEQIHDLLRAHDLTVAVYLLTHGHVDHISALADLQENMPAPVAIHAEDLRWAFDDSNCLLPFYPPPQTPAGTPQILKHGEQRNDAGLSYTVLSTPGHTPGSVCFHFADRNILFTGDTLCAGSVGRTDFPGGDSRALQRSLKLLSSLPENTVVCPGHGPQTLLETEKRTNYFMQAL